MKIIMKIHPDRKGNSNSNYNPKLSKYWKTMYYSMFRKWE